MTYDEIAHITDQNLTELVYVRAAFNGVVYDDCPVTELAAMIRDRLEQAQQETA